MQRLFRLRISKPRRQGGFTLLELLIAMAIMIVIMVGILNLFDRLNRLSRVQLNLAEMQQGLRVGQRELVHMTRMAGRGGLGGLALFADTDEDHARTVRGPALQVRNNLPSSQNDREVVVGTGVYALQGTDILIVRGAFNTPLYMVDGESSDFTIQPNGSGGRLATIVIKETTEIGITQNFAPLQALAANLKNEAIMMVDSLNPTRFEVGALRGVSAGAGTITLTVETQNSTQHADLYWPLSSHGGTVQLPFSDGVTYIGILEEYRYYILEEFAVSGDNSSELLPKLAYARVFPGTEAPYQPGDERIPIADNVFDLQVALAFDSNADGLANGQVTETADGTNDDWLFNGADDRAKFNADNAPWNNPPAGVNSLLFARITTLSRSAEPDPNFLADSPLDRLEDHDYSSSNPSAFNRFNGTTVGINGQPVDARKYRRQILQTVVDMRNVR